MARLAVEPNAPPPPQDALELRFQELVSLLIVACALVALADPGILLGAAVAGGWLWLYRPPLAARIACALLPLAPLIALYSFVQWGWPWRGWLGQIIPSGAAPVDGSLVQRGLYVEALAGPLWLEAALLAQRLRSRTVAAQIRRDHRLDKRRWRAISGRRQPMLPNPQRSPVTSGIAHPPGNIRLGVDAETNGPLDLALPDDLAAHVFLPGAQGTGKTTTLTRLADGALANGYGVVIVDCKAGPLGQAARQLAGKHGMPFHLVNPDSPDSLGYDACSGDAASVANKLVGSFTYGAEAEIYKSTAMEALPVVVRGLQAIGEAVTLEALYDAFAPGGMEKLAHKIPDDGRVRDRLLFLEDFGRDRAGMDGRAGFQHRLGALLEGKFGDLFRAEQPLDWDRALAEPSVTYVGLSTLASSQDVELMGRVVAQDLKQAGHRRIQQIANGRELLPVLTIFDEFAALKEAEQLADLLLQGREALMPVVVSTQYIPEATSLRKPCLAAGLLIVHRVEAKDAQDIADQFGTGRGTNVTVQQDFRTGYVEKGTMRREDRYKVHPNELRSFAKGEAAFLSVPQRRHTIVRIYPDTS